MNMLVGATALTATATPVHATADTTLLIALEKLRELKPVYDAAQARFDETWAEYRRRRPAWPKALRWDPSDGLDIRPWKTKDGAILDPTELANMRNVPQSDERKQRRLNEALKAADDAKAICDALKIEIGFREAEDHLNDVYFNQIIPTQKIIIDADPTVPGAIQAKASLLAEWFFEDVPEGGAEMNDYDRLVVDVVCGVVVAAA